ncbi:MAG TPA: FAD-dependent monooxygenase [Paracoccaceae bacterium]|nr:FAD-dependent monooxygenase [Paracoccaceae bacterium]
MTRDDTDILVVGGGLAGLAATAACAARGFATLGIDPAPPVTEEAAPGADLRSTAFLTPAVRFLARAGLWEALAPHSAPLRTMRILDAGGRENRVRERADFASAEIGAEPFGYNLPNWLLRREMAARLTALPHATLRRAAFESITPRLDHAIVRLSDGTNVAARLVVAADGRDSPLRQALGIPAPVLRYGQKALVFAVACTLPHQGTSTEIHRSGGPFTLVPLPDRDGIPHAAVVWMEDAAAAERLARLPVPDFEAALNARALGILGPLRLVTPRAVWPIRAQLALRFDGPRTALVAEAAHVMPPIGAQGLNTSLRDLDALVTLVAAARAAGRDIGGPDLLAGYHRSRWPDALIRVGGIDLLNRASQAELQPLRDLRRAGLALLHGLPPLRRAAMRLGLGAP